MRVNSFLFIALILLVVIGQAFIFFNLPNAVSREINKELIKVSSDSASMSANQLTPQLTLNPPTVTIQQVDTNKIDPIDDIKIESIKTLYDVSKSNTESANSLLTNILNIATLVLGILTLFTVLIVYIAIEKAREVNKLLDEAKEKSKFLDEKREAQSAEQQKPPDAATEEIVRLNTELRTVREREDALRRLRDQDLQTQNILLLRLHFESVYHLIFQSQLNILRISRNHPPDHKINKVILEALHRRTVWATSYPFDQFIGFLVYNYVLQFNVEDLTYSITPIGQLFLDYISANGYADKVNDSLLS